MAADLLGPYRGGFRARPRESGRQMTITPAIHEVAAAGAPPGSRLAKLARRCLSYPAALAAGLALVTLLAATVRLENPDLWWHLKIGESIWNTHSLPSADHFSFTAAG